MDGQRTPKVKKSAVIWNSILEVLLVIDQRRRKNVDSFCQYSGFWDTSKPTHGTGGAIEKA